MSKVEKQELRAHRGEIIVDVKKLVEKYRVLFDWDVAHINKNKADKLILKAIHKSLDHMQDAMRHS